MRTPLWWSRRSAAVWTQLSQGTRRIMPLLPLPYICRKTFSRFCPPRVNDHYLTTILNNRREAKVYTASRRFNIVSDTAHKSRKTSQNKHFSSASENLHYYTSLLCAKKADDYRCYSKRRQYLIRKVACLEAYGACVLTRMAAKHFFLQNVLVDNERNAMVFVVQKAEHRYRGRSSREYCRSSQR